METHATVLLAEDKDYDVRAIQRCWKRIGRPEKLKVVRDGEECLEYLMHQGSYADRARNPRPRILLLDLHMPKVDGIAVLRAIKSNPELRPLPVIVIASDAESSELRQAYELGAAAFFLKPTRANQLAEFLRTVMKFWETAALPEPLGAAARTNLQINAGTSP